MNQTMSLLFLLALGAGACNQHEIVRTRWHELSGLRPGAAKLIEVQEGLVYVTPKMPLTFVAKGREVKRNWQEITLAKNTFTAISATRETFTFALSDVEKIVAHGKVAGEITGVITDTRGGAPAGGMGGAGGGGAGMGRPMF